mmetsp:Transcript_146753/g.255999  ORF Transcript_146753/g.255999 Transcript_146753/m.255999 type:complete len:205 (+) Transcript_146753:1186-1800(+)
MPADFLNLPLPFLFLGLVERDPGDRLRPLELADRDDGVFVRELDLEEPDDFPPDLDLLRLLPSVESFPIALNLPLPFFFFFLFLEEPRDDTGDPSWSCLSKSASRSPSSSSASAGRPCDFLFMLLLHLRNFFTSGNPESSGGWGACKASASTSFMASCRTLSISVVTISWSRREASASAGCRSATPSETVRRRMPCCRSEIVKM